MRHGSRRPDYTKDHLKMVCKTVYWDMHYKDLLGSIANVWYCIPASVVMHGLRCRIKYMIDKVINQTIQFITAVILPLRIFI